MRTEQQLRDAFTALAERTQGSDAVFTQILTRTAPSTLRRRRLAIVLAAVVVVLVAIGVPAVLVNRTAVPADTRAPGNWNLIHRVDLPPGWGVTTSTVSPDIEISQLGDPVGVDQSDQACSVSVAGPAHPAPTIRDGSPVDVNGRPGTYVEPSFNALGGIYWRYTDNAWANVSCSVRGADDRDLSIEMARRVVFDPVPLVLPFRLSATPDGYQVGTVLAGVDAASERSTGAQLDPIDKLDDRPSIQISVAPGTTEIPPYLAGWESDTVAGLPAVLSARDGRLCLNTQGHTVCILAEGGEPADLTVSLWPAGRRALLVEVAQHLKLAADLADEKTGWNANRALPG